MSLQTRKVVKRPLAEQGILAEAKYIALDKVALDKGHSRSLDNRERFILLFSILAENANSPARRPMWVASDDDFRSKQVNRFDLRQFF